MKTFIFTIVSVLFFSVCYGCGWGDEVKKSEYQKTAEGIWSAIQKHIKSTGHAPKDLDELAESGAIAKESLKTATGDLFAVLKHVDNLANPQSNKEFFYLFCADPRNNFSFYRQSYNYPWEQRLGEIVEVEGYARNRERGAVLLVEPDGEIWVDGLSHWDEAKTGTLQEITGRVVESDELLLKEPVEIELFEGIKAMQTKERHLRIVEWELREKSQN